MARVMVQRLVTPDRAEATVDTAVVTQAMESEGPTVGTRVTTVPTVMPVVATEVEAVVVVMGAEAVTEEATVVVEVEEMVEEMVVVEMEAGRVVDQAAALEAAREAAAGRVVVALVVLADLAAVALALSVVVWVLA